MPFRFLLYNVQNLYFQKVLVSIVVSLGLQYGFCKFGLFVFLPFQSYFVIHRRKCVRYEKTIKGRVSLVGRDCRARTMFFVRLSSRCSTPSTRTNSDGCRTVTRSAGQRAPGRSAITFDGGAIDCGASVRDVLVRSSFGNSSARGGAISENCANSDHNSLFAVAGPEVV